MPVPMVAIVGRPNVGKSSLFNWLAGRRIAIVEPTAGVTRDRVVSLAKLREGDKARYFELIDTGGMGNKDCDNLTAEIEGQIQTAIDEAQLILFVVDTRSGLMPLDQHVAERLRGVSKPVICVANKSDRETLDPQAAEFHRLGLGPVVCVSAQQNRGKDELIELIERRLPKGDSSEAERDVAMKLAIVGRRNTGKSTFINCLAESERVIVSEVPGTTRDSIDVRFERDGQTFIAIDTAGVRRRSSVKSDIEFYSLARAERSVRRADVVMLFFDAEIKVSRVDKQLAGYILEHYKPAIFVVNKWDLLVKDLKTGTMGDYLRKVFPSLDYVPIAFITAKDGRNVQMALNLAQNLHKQSSARASTADLNKVLRMALAQAEPPMRHNRRPKIFFATQVATNPPTIVLITNGPQLFDHTYQRYLLKMFRDHLPFGDIPIKLYLRHKHREEDTAGEEGDAPPRRRGDTAKEPEPRRKKPPKSTKRLPGEKKKFRPKKTPELWKD